MSGENQARPKGAGAWGQAITAVVLIGGLGAALLIFRHTHPDDGARSSPAVTCSHDKPTAKGSPYLSGTQLCELLYVPNLAELLGTPGEEAKSTTTSGSTPPTDDKGLSGPYAQVSFPTWTVNLAATYHNLPMAQVVKIFGADARQRTVLGHPAVSYADRAIRISLGSGSGGSAPGAPSTVLSVSMDPAGSGKSFELTLWRTDGASPPDDTTLLRVADSLLPTLPGWTTT
ncbi:DUF6215 domain-containing protein [Streptomyces sp. NRRL F-5123]|uniref:DUF6215 domain-containing protein n=1 Tax=Streptomyces sp. NRRL F-5123 TaxID=1463856 RepID=UPI0005BC6AC3|nr:DUF6215 domain-containing protein [Streptomyces sp. NRRL F-5123]